MGEAEQVLVGDDVVHEPPVERRPGVDEVAGRAHLPGPADADGLGQQHREAPPGLDPDPGMGVGEAGAVGGNEEVAVERDLEAAGDRRAVHRADDRLRRRWERARVGARCVAGGARVGEGRTPGAQLLEVQPGAERGIGAGEDQHADVVVRVGVTHRGPQGPDQVARQGVAGVRAVEGDRGDAAVHLGQDDVGHVGPSSGSTVSPRRCPRAAGS